MTEPENLQVPVNAAHSGAANQCLEVLRDVCQHVAPHLPYSAIVDAFSAAKHHGDALPMVSEAAQHLGLEVADQAIADVLRFRDERLLAAVARAPEGWIVVTGLQERRPRVRRLWTGGGERAVPHTRRQLLGVGREARSWLILSARRAYATGEQHSTPWQRVRSLVRLERADVKAVVGFAVAVSVLSLLTPLAIQTLVNTIAFGTVLQPLILLSLALLLGLGLAAVLMALEAYTVEVLQRRFLVRVAEDLADRLPVTTAQERDRTDLVELGNRFFDVITVQKAGAQLMLEGLAVTLQTIAGLTLISLYHPYLFVFAVFLVIILALVFLRARGATHSAMLESKAKFSVGAWIEELARHPPRFRGHAGRRFAAAELRSRAGAYLQRRRDHFSHIMTILTGGLAVGALSIVALLTVGGWLVVKGELTLGQLVAAELVMSAVAVGFNKLGQLAEKTFDLAAALDKIGKLFNLEVEPSGGEALLGEAAMAVSARDVGVCMAGFSTSLGFSADIEPGEVVGIDAGDVERTPLLQTLAGLRPPSTGQITYDRVLNADPDDLGDHVAYVGDEPLMAATVLDNLRVRTPALDRESARALLEAVGLEEAMERLPSGIETPLLPSGLPLSRRESRRLKLAVALAHAPRLLVLDEALDDLGLGGATWNRLVDTIFEPAGRMTCVIASSRSEVLERCDRVLSTRTGAN